MSELEHAKYSPSTAHRWMECPGSVALCEGVPRSDNEHARQGTAAHEVAEWTLKSRAKLASAFVGKLTTANKIKVTREMAEYVQVYVDKIMEYAEGNSLAVEERVDYSEFLGQPNSFGTSDCIIITADGSEIQVHDLKYGYNTVNAENNHQMMMYAAGAMAKYDGCADFKTVRMVIHQPRRDWISEWDCTVDYLKTFLASAKIAAEVAEDCCSGIMDPYENLVPGEKQCGWCPVKARCPARNQVILSTVTDQFEDLTDLAATKARVEKANPRLLTNAQLGMLFPMLDMVHDWAATVRAAITHELLSARDVPGTKLIAGRAGDRSWVDEELVEDTLKSMRLAAVDMYKSVLISPTQAEKLLKKNKPRKWKRIEELITRKEGQPAVAPISDKKPALKITPASEAFDDLTAEADFDLA